MDKKNTDRKSLRKTGRHSGTLYYIMLLGKVCTVADCMLTVCVRWPCIRHGQPLSQVSWGHKACWTTKQWSLPPLFPMEQPCACVYGLLCASVLEQGRPSPPYGVTHGFGLTLPWVLNDSSSYEGHCADRQREGKGNRNFHQMCSSIRKWESWVCSVTCHSYLLQQFVSFCLQQVVEIITARRVLGTSSFLLLQISYHLSNIQPNEKK